ncbi:MAG: hypothetical protein R3E39_23390 [Anaerolineae bacterium]
MSWKLRTQTQEISMVDRLVHYARTHNCTATEAAQDMRDILKVSPKLEDINAANEILQKEKEEIERRNMGDRGEFAHWHD